MANLEVEAMNEGRSQDDPKYELFNLKIPAKWKKYYTLAGDD
jgi:hypothetical protein